MDLKPGELVLHSLRIHNYRLYEDLDIQFHDKLTVIVGENGAGKTTILDAAAASLSAYLAGFDGLGLYKIWPEDARRVCTQVNKTIDSQPQYPVEIEATASIYAPKINGKKNLSDLKLDEVMNDTPIQWKRLRNSASPHARQAIKDIAPMEKTGYFYQAMIRMGNSVSGSLITAPILSYYSISRLWEDERADSMFSTTFFRQDAYNNCLNARLNLEALNTWFERMTYKDLQSQKEDFTFKAVREVMEEVYRKESGATDVQVRSNLDTHKIEIQYQDSDGQWNMLFLSQLSAGYKITLCLFADIAYRMAVLNPHLQENVLKATSGIVLIDEVDLHLHPKWQQEILGDLQSVFPKVQFIVTTHAPAVIASISNEHIQILKGKQVIPATIETFGKDANAVLRTIMNVTERPKPAMEEFDTFYQLLDQEKYDEASQHLDYLDEKYGEDSELASMRLQLSIETM